MAQRYSTIEMELSDENNDGVVGTLQAGVGVI